MKNSFNAQSDPAIPSDTNDSSTQLVAEICSYLQEIHPEQVTLQALGQQFSVSPFHLQRTFKRIMGISPKQYADGLRVDEFKSNVRKGKSITESLYHAGFGSSSRLYERSDLHLGMTPTSYQNEGDGMAIFYSVVDSPLGKLLVAVTERGVCKVCLGDTEGVLIGELEYEFSKAERIRDDEEVGYWVEKIIAYLEGWQPDLDLPLDIRATAFQRRVWEELQQIPVGETRSYSDIAEAIGQPSAIRAVANACGKNPVALVIPCHRIIRKSGEMGGYRWGLERKQRLLEQERVYAQAE